MISYCRDSDEDRFDRDGGPAPNGGRSTFPPPTNGEYMYLILEVSPEGLKSIQETPGVKLLYGTSEMDGPSNSILTLQKVYAVPLKRLWKPLDTNPGPSISSK